MSVSITAVRGVPTVREGDDLCELLLAALSGQGLALEPGDVVVVTSKVVAKAEGRTQRVEDTEAAKVELVEREATRVLRRRGALRITETVHGFVNANAGVDLSNSEPGVAVLLPRDPDRSARRIRADLRRRAGVDVAVIITDTVGRAWRRGVADVAIGVAGLVAVLDLRGTRDAYGRLLEATEVAIADEVAAAANLALAKAAGTPFAIVRGLDTGLLGDGSGADLVRPPDEDLFR
ncbi:MAG TPA: coenzyme F420-0:L-glutamate ligase [Acidimicrobiales bacterium]|nr:coenzyme F420-0:L-glutamate ligase [Acidimicrobiales bacterium]